MQCYLLAVRLTLHDNTVTLQISFLAFFIDYHVYLQVQIILYHLGILLPHEGRLSKVKNSYIKSAYIKSAYYSVCDDCGVNVEDLWINGDSFYKGKCANFGDCVIATQRSSPENITRWIITLSRGFTRKAERIAIALLIGGTRLFII